MMIKQQIEHALSQEFPVESLRDLAIRLNETGISKDEIIREFYEVDNMLKSENRDDEVDQLGDVLDMLTGYYVGRNLDLK